MELNIKFGKNFGQLLAQIAYEHLTEGNLQKAIEVYKEALIGIGDEHVKMLLMGEGVVEVADDNVTVTLEDYDAKKHANYFIYKPEKELSWCFEETLDFECLSCLNNYLLNTTTYKIKTNGQLNKYFNNVTYVEITSDNILEYIKKYGWLDTLSKNKEGEEIYNSLKKIADGEKRDQMLLAQTLYAIDEVRKNIKEIIGLFAIANYFGYTVDGETKNKVLDYLNQVKSYFDFEPYPEIFEKHIYPCYQKYEAGFIAPNGDIYGMNGSERNLLHMAIADKIAEDVDLPWYLEDGKNNTDFALDRAGWVKFHYGTFNKYICANHLTDAQAETIYKYANDFLNGIITFEHCIVNTNDWKQMDNIMREKKFQ